ncbi:GlxA family transcriptional regulator [Methylovorus menthalis]|uniref:GlxA family transcriptional regulator n=1 Tax=Methylovorus menthalis TaxID=1002227 RepID=UPI001E4B5019|nr:GlxA family transcriptional regulator [Methylovorus menthalis]MCB4810011.1 GlxA family transcriptional regulator [Methylovorus menthalis]
MMRIGFVVFPGFQILDLAAMTVFEMANIVSHQAVYELHLVSEHGGAVTSSTGVSVLTDAFGDQAFDTVIMMGSIGIHASSPGLLDYLQQATAQSRRIASICTGAFMLAEAGLLDGLRASTHWRHARELQRRYPKVKVEEDRIFIREGKVWTSAGMTACIDLSLALVEADIGLDASRTIAQRMVVYHRRTGGQSQFSALLTLEPKSDRIQTALTYARSNLHKPLSVDDLADVAHLSPRQFSRAFRAETGQSPAKAIENLRVEAAKSMIETARHPIDVVARETGFADPERMRRAFIRTLGHPPQAIKRMARTQTH